MSDKKAPLPWPPRVWVDDFGVDELTGEKPVCLRAWSLGISYAKNEYLSLSEHTHLLAEAVREARAQVWEESGRLAMHFFMMNKAGSIQQECFQKASELRKGATTENGGKV